MVIEDQSIDNMTASRQGTAEKPSKNIKQKAGIKLRDRGHCVLATAAGSFRNVLCDQAQESWVSANLAGPAQALFVSSVPFCGSTRKKVCPNASTVCSCGFVATRGQAAVLSIDSQVGNRRELPPGPQGPETLSTAA
jgi:hypothetical protein